MLREGFLNNTLAELFVTKLLNKIRSSPSKRYETEVLETVEEQEFSLDTPIKRKKKA